MDWAPEAVIEDTLALLERHDARATLFATHRSAALHGCDRERFELGLHPNFNPLLLGQTPGRSAADVMDELVAEYPEARGARSHALTYSSAILNLMAERGLTYEVNQFVPYQRPVQPYMLWMGLLRIPYNWEDDVHWTYGYSFDDHRLSSGPGWNVVDFHPIHLFLNTDCQARYDDAKAHYQDPARLSGFVNRGPNPGARDMLVRMLEEHAAQSAPSPTLGQLAAGVMARAVASGGLGGT